MRRARFCIFLTGLLLTAPALAASDWQTIKNEAKGQTVWFNAWVATRQSIAISTG